MCLPSDRLVAPTLSVTHSPRGRETGCGPQGEAARPLGCFSSRRSLVDLVQDNHGNSVHLGIFFMGIFVRNRIGRQAVIYR